MLAGVDGARRDLLETLTHDPRGYMSSMYTTFPWSDLCVEVAKLRISPPRRARRRVGNFL
jgi:hypothetical protein